jgi:hypothetical protein
MHKRFFASAFATTATVLAVGSLSAAPAMAKGEAESGERPCGPAADVTSTTAGIRETQMTPYHGGISRMTAPAVDEQADEVVAGAVQLPPPAGGS